MFAVIEDNMPLHLNISLVLVIHKKKTATVSKNILSALVWLGKHLGPEWLTL